MTTCDHLVYGSDCGVPCSTESTLVDNLHALLGFPDLTEEQLQAIGRNVLRLMPHLGNRLPSATAAHAHAH